MTDNATAQALAGEEPVSEAPESILDAPDAPASDDGLSDALKAVWDKHNPGEGQEATEAVDEAQEAAPEAEEAPKPEPVKAPYDLPKEYNELWPDLTEAQREVVARTYRENANKWGEIGRQVKGIEPIRDVLVKAAEEMPSLRDMTPDQVAAEMFTLAQWAQRLNSDPEAALREIAEARGITLSGEAPKQQSAPDASVAALKAQIAKLEQQVAQAANPEYLANQIAAHTAQERLQNEINSFSASKEHWNEVEPHMPAAIQLVRGKLGEGASATDVLSAAYDLTVNQFVSSPKASQDAAAKAATVDPAKAQEAKSFNVRSDATPSKAPKTERQLMKEVWRKHHN
jgi:murein L,D-transpeptidase YcbB/YkuD